MSVLVVDDYSTMIRIIRNLLKQLGFENIDDASDGSAALNKMRGKKYGLVISDWNMEPMTGFDLLKEVRGDPNLAMTPFINNFVRANEAEADIFGLNASQEPDGFAEVALKLAEYRKLDPGPLEEWIFYDHPSGRARVERAMRWLKEHPPQ